MRNPFRRRKALTASPDALATIQDGSANLYRRLGGTNVNQQIQAAFSRAQSAGYEWMYQHSPSARTVIDLIARNIAQLDIRLYEESGTDQRTPRPDHPAADTIKKPNSDQTADLFVFALVRDFLIYDNAYALKFRGAPSDPVTLVPIPPSRVEVIGNGLVGSLAYVVYRTDGTKYERAIPPEDMLHWKGWNGNDATIGFSHLETLRDVLSEEAAIQTAIVELMKSGLSEPTWVKRPLDAPEWSNKDRARFEEDLHNRLRRANRYPPVMEEGMELAGFGVSPRDAQMLEVRKYILETVATEYGLPAGMVNVAGTGPSADIANARSEFYADTLPPYCESLAHVLDRSVLEEEYYATNLCFEFDLDEKMMGDERLKALVSASGRPVLLTNEARSMVNRPPVPGGDELVTPLNVVVGEKPSPQTMPPPDPNTPAQDGSHRDGDAPVAASTNGHTKQLQVSSVPSRVADVERQSRYIGEAKGVFDRLLERQSKAASQAQHDTKKKAFDAERWIKELSGDLHRLIASIVEREGGIYTARLAGSNFDMKQVANYVAAMADDIAKNFNQTTQADAEADSPVAAIDRAKGERASIAATSVGARATTFARREAAKQAPGTGARLQTWVADTDRHAALEGVSVPLDSDWGGISPGSEPNCACSVAIT